jgi:hypothetical protein
VDVASQQIVIKDDLVRKEPDHASPSPVVIYYELPFDYDGYNNNYEDMHDADYGNDSEQ